MNAVSAIDDRTAATIRQAIGLASGGRIAEACELGERALEEGGDRTALNAMLGMLRCRSGEFEAAVRKIIQTARAKGLAVGIHFSLEPERQIRWVKEGANMIIHSFDIALFTQRLIADMKVIKEGVGDVPSPDAAGHMVV